MTKNELTEKERYKSIIGKNVRKYRELKKLTQEKLAEKAGISVSFCANIENGTKGTSVVVLKDLAAALEVSVDALLSDGEVTNRLSNLEVMCKNRPDEFVEKIERLVQSCVEIFDN